MNITHVSDIHGNVACLANVYWHTDIWVFNGDVFPTLNPREYDAEVRYQRAWFRRNASAFRAAIGKARVLSVRGNHDFTSLAYCMREHGIDANDIDYDGVPYGGHLFAGFEGIPATTGLWTTEASDATLDALSRRALASGADVLVTHAPPYGILDAGLGIRPLADRLKGEHDVKVHLFGHIHEHAGQDVTIGGVRYFNGSLGARLVVV